MIDIIINKTKYKCNTTESLSVTDFVELNEKIEKVSNGADFVRTLLIYLSNIPKYLIEVIDEQSLLQIDISHIYKITKKNIDYDYDSIDFGRFINVNKYIENKEYQKACARLLLPIDATTDDVNNYKQLDNNYAMSMIADYNEWLKWLFDTFSDVFIKKEIPEDEVDENDNKWLELLYNLADNVLDVDRVSDTKVINIFMYLRMKSNENTKANQSDI